MKHLKLVTFPHKSVCKRISHFSDPTVYACIIYVLLHKIWQAASENQLTFGYPYLCFRFKANGSCM
jgi:hypothetical protein